MWKFKWFLEYKIKNKIKIQLKKNKQLDTYKDYYTGRPNLFILFIIKSLKLLNQNGILSFILPNNFLSCLYYDKTRQYINENYTILHIVNGINDYIDTAQETIIIIIQNKQKHKKHSTGLISHELVTENFI